MWGSGRNPVDRLGNLIVLGIGTMCLFLGIGGLVFTASVLSYRLLEWLFGAV